MLQKIIFEEIVTDRSPNLMQDIHLQFSRGLLNSKQYKHFSKSLGIRHSGTKDTKKILKVAREK